MKVVRVIPQTPADKVTASCLPDDLITAVDGSSFQEQNFYQLLNTKVDEKTLLTVKGKDGKERKL